MAAVLSNLMASDLALLDQPQRRAAPRIAVNWRARVMVSAPRFVDATVIDLSEGGLGMHCEQRVREHQVYDLAVAVPNHLQWDRFEVIQLRGSVKSVVLSGGKFRLGVQFVAISTAARKLMQPWIKAGGVGFGRALQGD
jgi:hypothetical protein